MILIVGAGITGLTLAERYASIGKEVLLVEKRSHIGGNCYDEWDEECQTLVHKYGAHIFHTNDENVWGYVNRFAQFNDYVHKVVSYVDGDLVPLPINIDTINILMGTELKTQLEMVQWLVNHKETIHNPQNSYEVAISTVGKKLYKKLFKHYTKKMWGMSAKELDTSVISRIPINYFHNTNYFSDKFQGLPVNGYTNMFRVMLQNPLITVALNCVEEFTINSDITEYEKVIYTGCVDDYFKHNFGKLNYRSLRFSFDSCNTNNKHAVINHPSKHDEHIRFVDHNVLTGLHHHKHMTSIEYPCVFGEPMYPIPNEINRTHYQLYKALAGKTKNVHFIGRLAEYKYKNMDVAIKDALDLFERLER